MRTVEVVPGRCLLAVAAIEYLDSDLGPYNEVAITLPIAFGDRTLPALSAIRQGWATR